METEIWLDITPEELARKVPDLMKRIMPEIFEQLKVDSALMAAEIMRAEVPVRTGALMESVQVIPLPDGFRVYPTAPHARVVLTGRPGGKPIFPRRARFLRFEWRGRICFARRVIQGAMKANPYVQRTSFRLSDYIRKRVHELFSARAR